MYVCYFFHQLQEAPASAAGPSEEGPSKAVRSPKDSLSPKTETDSSGDTSSTSWVVDSSGFLSPTGPALKEVLDLVDGVSIPNTLHLHVYRVVTKCWTDLPFYY